MSILDRIIDDAEAYEPTPQEHRWSLIEGKAWHIFQVINANRDALPPRVVELADELARAIEGER